MDLVAFLEKMLFGNGKPASADKDTGGASGELKHSLLEAFPDNVPNEAWRPRVNLVS